MRSLLRSYLGSRRSSREMSALEVRRSFTQSSDDRHVGVRVLLMSKLSFCAAEQHASAESLAALRLLTRRSLAMRALLWSYLGQRQFLREMSRFEIRHFLTLADADRREL
jgi:hypothetical protein